MRSRPSTSLAASTLAGLLALTLWTSACDGDDPTPAQDSTGMGDHSGSTEPSEATIPPGTDSDDIPESTSLTTEQPPALAEVPVIEGARLTSDQSDPNFHRVRGLFAIDAVDHAEARLRVELGTTCYPWANWQTEEIPDGHRWPASCDAFDRNFEILLREVGAPEEQPLFEVERAITPFGGPMTLEVDITDLANARPGEWELIVHVTTWSDGSGQVSGSAGGWNVDAWMGVREGPPPREVIDVIPLFDGSVRNASNVAEGVWTAPEGVEAAVVELRTTGHGGAQDGSDACIGPAEEFCRRIHNFYHNGEVVDVQRPWRDDCDELCTLGTIPGSTQQYCQENPMGAIPSVRAPRANWCPGDVTPPITFTGSRFTTAGEHRFEQEIMGVIEGGSWRTSMLVKLYATPTP